MVPSDFGKALEGFTRMLGAPGEDGVFRFQPSPVDDTPARPEDDDEAVRGWFDTATSPELARVVADAEAQARRAVPPPGLPDTPQVPAAPWPPPQQLAAGPGAPAPTPAPAPTAPLTNGEPESAAPTAPRGLPRSPEEPGPADPGGSEGAAAAPDAAGPARPGYPSPPPRT
jgi:hypothetical protein